MKHPYQVIAVLLKKIIILYLWNIFISVTVLSYTESNTWLQIQKQVTEKKPLNR